MQYIILDLEWNGAYSRRRKKFINEIIEFGAIKIDENLNIIENFSMLIKPQVGKKLSGKVKELTHISNEELAVADNTFSHVLSKFIKFLDNQVLLTWGTTDILTLIDNYEYYYKDKTLPFLKKYLNLQYYCETRLNAYNPSKQLGLTTIAELLQIKFENNSLHRALEDSILSYDCFVKLYNKEYVEKCIEVCDEEFFIKTTFKTVMITDINNSLINKYEMFICCKTCQIKANKLTPWEVRNKSFRAIFYCDKCKNKFIGRIQYKLKYDGVTVKKSVSPFIPEKAKSTEISDE